DRVRPVDRVVDLQAVQGSDEGEVGMPFLRLPRRIRNILGAGLLLTTALAGAYGSDVSRANALAEEAEKVTAHRLLVDGRPLGYVQEPEDVAQVLTGMRLRESRDRGYEVVPAERVVLSEVLLEEPPETLSPH